MSKPSIRRISSAGRVPDIGSLTAIVEAVREALPTRRSSHEKMPRVDLEVLRSLISVLAPMLSESRRAGSFFNPWAIAGLGRREVRNAAVLAALWDPRYGGDVAVRFLDRFLAQLDEPTVGRFPTYETLRRGYAIRAEHCPMGDLSDRVDITVEGRDFLIGIEVKIDAGEGERQLERYVESLVRRSTSRIDPVVVFLAPFSPDLEGATPGTWIDHVTVARWSNVDIAARKTSAGGAKQDDYLLHLMRRFADHVRHF